MDELGGLELLDSEHDLRDFDCGEAALNSWLARHALRNQASNNSKTHVLPTTSACGKKVIGFYALVGAVITHDQAIPSLHAGTPKSQVIPVILLARLAVALEYQKRGIGKALLKDALKQCVAASRIIGLRTVLIHAKPGAGSFYIREAGFEPSPTDPLHLILPIQTLIESV